ncbi:MAG TPA: TonB family protein [Vicinamibacterales bacterium]|nr:TonB family protein [Vicinamibacterales bacterium]
MSDLRVDAPAEVRFLFQQTQKRSAGALAISLGIHAALFGLAIWVAMDPSVQRTATSFVDSMSKEIVWLDVPGPGGGGGGGGNKMPEPIKKAELKGQDKITVPVEKPPAALPKEKPPETPAQNLTVPAQTLASADLAQAGAIEGIPTSESLGLGKGGGAGTGQGTGIGPGQGSGLGPGWGGGTGGGAYRPGNGVETPRLIREFKPLYTAPAMRAKIQGEVLLECVVQPDGTVGNIRVVRSLDSTFGLDQEAIKAARQWRFSPGTLKGEPVPVLVTIAIAFTLR